MKRKQSSDTGCARRQGAAKPFSWLLILLLLLPLPSSSSWVEHKDEEEEEDSVEIITGSSPCSVTCGLGMKEETLCHLNNSIMAHVEGGGLLEVSSKCRTRMVNCRQPWLCGLRTLTVRRGEKLEIECLGEVMQVLGRSRWRVMWLYARGIISSDNHYFARLKTLMSRIVLDPVKEEHAGTYRCDVQNAALRRVKRVYWGVRVVPAWLLDDYSPQQKGLQPTQQSHTVASAQGFHWTLLLNVGLNSVLLATALAAVTMLLLYAAARKRGGGAAGER
ncbi:transmembrane protein 81 [Genypterus blacodes]|uniref:transmembrane protein 81 n=1 Tax=Genypterus blacodes TaxID=154954 RepID=UPI003F7698C2